MLFQSIKQALWQQWCCIIIIVLCINQSYAHIEPKQSLIQSPIKNTLISLNFYQTDPKIVLQALADYQELNLVINDDIQTPITIKLTEVLWEKALEIVLKSAKLTASLEQNILFVSQKIEPLAEHEQKALAERQFLLSQPMEYLSLSVNHIDLTKLIQLIQQQKLLSERGKVFADERSNMLVIYDIQNQFSAIKKLIAEFDQVLPQIHISAHIVTMSSESLSQLGVNWGYTGHSSQSVNSVDLGLSVANPAAQMGFSIAKVAGNLLNLELSALEAENQVEIIASPNLLTSHQQTASIKQGTEIPYEVSNGNNGATSIEFKQAVLGLEVTPRVLNNNQLELNLHISQNTAGRTIKRGDGGEALAIDTQEIKTQVIVKDTETLVLGGIFQQLKIKDNRQIPGLNRLPLLGGLFKYNEDKLQRRELVIFITPTIIHR